MKSASKIIVLILFFAMFMPVYGFKLPSMGDDEEDSLSQYMRKPMESDIESARRPAPEVIPERAITSNTNINRPASEDKSPMYADNIWDMEFPYWEGFEMSPWNYASYPIPTFANPPAIIGYAQPGVRNFKFPEEAYEEGEIPGAYMVGCIIRAPLIQRGWYHTGGGGTEPGWILRCNDPYKIDFSFLAGVVTGVYIKGPGKVSFKSGFPFPEIIVTPYANIQSGAKITVTVTTLTVVDGAKTYSSCEATTVFDNCEECTTCNDYIPEIYATADTISPGGKQYLWVNSLGLACPPYWWSVSGTGYSLINSVTENDFDTVILKAATGDTCGVDTDAYATVTVTDSCGVSDTYKIRGPNGQWNLTLHEGSGGGQLAECETENMKYTEYHCTLCIPPVPGSSCAINCGSVLGDTKCPDFAPNPYCVANGWGTQSCGVNERNTYEWGCP